MIIVILKEDKHYVSHRNILILNQEAVQFTFKAFQNVFEQKVSCISICIFMWGQS